MNQISLEITLLLLLLQVSSNERVQVNRSGNMTGSKCGSKYAWLPT